MAGVAEESAGRSRHAAAGGRKDGRKRSLGAETAGAHEGRWRRRCRARSTGPRVEPADRREDTGACHQASETAGVARLRADVRQRATGQAARHRCQQGDGARMDGGVRVVEAATAQTGRDTLLASTTERIRRVGAVGYLESRLAGRQRRSGALSGANDRRRDQPQRRKLRAARRDAREHGRAVAVCGAAGPDGRCLHRPGGDVLW